MRSGAGHPHGGRAHEAGYTLIELIISVAILLVISGTVFQGVMNMTNVNGMVTNRSEMHSGVRNATELLQQEVGQAGRISLPAPVTLTAAVASGSTTATVSSTDDMFVGEQLVFGAGDAEETLTVSAIAGTQITTSTVFGSAHPAGASVRVQGGFANGVVPTDNANGSTDTVLKIFGDINGDGRMVYVEYSCDTAAGNLYRNSMPFDQVGKSAVTVSEALLSNIVTNPGNVPCFTYQEQTVAGTTYVVDVAITLTVQTAARDPITGEFQRETKALLNVSPRNVFNVWQAAGLGLTNRIQPMPPSVTALLPDE